MAVQAVVRDWRDQDGWGVVDSPETPGGCWAHFSHLATDGYRTAHAGDVVMLEWEFAYQDGFNYRAVRLWPLGEGPTTQKTTDYGSAFQSRLTFTFDDTQCDADR